MSEHYGLSTDEAIVCRLDIDQFGDRVGEWIALAYRALVARTQMQEGVLLRFRREAGVEAELRRLVRLEAACCPFLSVQITDLPSELALAVRGPAGAADLVEAFLALPASAPSRPNDTDRPRSLAATSTGWSARRFCRCAAGWSLTRGVARAHLRVIPTYDGNRKQRPSFTGTRCSDRSSWAGSSTA